MAGVTTLYDRIVRVTHVYLGPAADRFIDRQIRNHLHKAPQDISFSDLDKLIDWIRAAVSFLTEDSEIVEEYTAELSKLTKAQDGNQSKDAHGNA